MNIKDVMTKDVQVISPQARLIDAARQMKDVDAGAIPVCDDGRLVGMITDRDIVVRAVAQMKNVETTTVAQVMSEGVNYCFEDQPVKEASRLMADRQIRRLVVLDRDKKLCGIVSLGDLATETGDIQQTGEALEKISKAA